MSLYFLKHPEPSQPHHATVIRADARAMGAITATRAGGGNKRPRTTVKATDCKVTRADGSTYVIAARTSNRTAPKNKVRVIAEDRRSELFRSFS